MLCLRSMLILSPFSFRTFIEHLPYHKPNSFKFTANTRKSLITATPINSSHFETLNSHQKHQISLYVDTLLEWNQKMNLTAVTERSEVMERHIEDSLAILSPMNESYTSHCGSSRESVSLVDVGTGAGLPGLILAIACPGWKVTLLESMNKRCLFLEHAINVTGVSNVKVIRDRAENFGHTLEYRESFDIAVARAVAELRVLAEYCIPLVRMGGLFVAAKGHDPQLDGGICRVRGSLVLYSIRSSQHAGVEVRNAERAINLLGATLLHQHLVESHGPFGQRTAIICFKDRPTSRKYPRSPGTPAKMPL